MVEATTPIMLQEELVEVEMEKAQVVVVQMGQPILEVEVVAQVETNLLEEVVEVVLL